MHCTPEHTLLSSSILGYPIRSQILYRTHLLRLTHALGSKARGVGALFAHLILPMHAVLLFLPPYPFPVPCSLLFRIPTLPSFPVLVISHTQTSRQFDCSIYRENGISQLHNSTESREGKNCCRSPVPLICIEPISLSHA